MRNNVEISKAKLVDINCRPINTLFLNRNAEKLSKGKPGIAINGKLGIADILPALLKLYPDVFSDELGNHVNKIVHRSKI